MTCYKNTLREGSYAAVELHSQLLALHFLARALRPAPPFFFDVAADSGRIKRRRFSAKALTWAYFSLEMLSMSDKLHFADCGSRRCRCMTCNSHGDRHCHCCQSYSYCHSTHYCLPLACNRHWRARGRQIRPCVDRDKRTSAESFALLNKLVAGWQTKMLQEWRNITCNLLR
jgi:hypothetical protein